MTKKILAHVGMGTGRHAPFNKVYPQSLYLANGDDAEQQDYDALVIWGGEDISPSLYGQKVGPKTWADERLSRRDIVESLACRHAIARGIPIIGVCRGAQLLCALAGGRLIQHVNGHGRTHSITTHDGRQLFSSSVHHQMQFPYDVEHKLLAWSTERQSDVYLGETVNTEHEYTLQPEAEVVYYPKIKALAIQGHPEFMDEEAPFVQYCNDLVREYL